MAYGVQFSTKNLSDYEIYSILINFAKHSKNYTYLEKQSKEYTDFVQVPSCCIEYQNDRECIFYAITKSDKTYTIENIVPCESGFIPTDVALEYAKTFVCDLRKFLKGNNCNNMKVSLSRRKKLKLKDVITGKTTRHYFERYLNSYGLTPENCTIAN